MWFKKVSCAKIYLLQQHRISTRDEDESCSYSLLFLGFLMSLVISERRVKTIGYLSLKGKAEFSGHPPTLTVPCSSIDHRSLIIGSNLDRELLLLILAFRSLRLRLNSWMLSVVILLIYAFPFLVVQLLWWWLSSTCSSWKFLSYNLSIWLPLPVGEPWHAVDAAKIHPDCSRAHNSLNLRFSYLNIKTFSAYKWKFLSHRNTGPLRQLDLISSTSFPQSAPPWAVIGWSILGVNVSRMWKLYS